jgi:hypothetical protein
MTKENYMRFIIYIQIWYSLDILYYLLGQRNGKKRKEEKGKMKRRKGARRPAVPPGRGRYHSRGQASGTTPGTARYTAKEAKLPVSPLPPVPRSVPRPGVPLRLGRWYHPGTTRCTGLPSPARAAGLPHATSTQAPVVPAQPSRYYRSQATNGWILHGGYKPPPPSSPPAASCCTPVWLSRRPPDPNPLPSTPTPQSPPPCPPTTTCGRAAGSRPRRRARGRTTSFHARVRRPPGPPPPPHGGLLLLLTASNRRTKSRRLHRPHLRPAPPASPTSCSRGWPYSAADGDHGRTARLLSPTTAQQQVPYLPLPFTAKI